MPLLYMGSDQPILAKQVGPAASDAPACNAITRKQYFATRTMP